jgi:hypothetical protein
VLQKIRQYNLLLRFFIEYKTRNRKNSSGPYREATSAASACDNRPIHNEKTARRDKPCFRDAAKLFTWCFKIQKMLGLMRYDSSSELGQIARHFSAKEFRA